MTSKDLISYFGQNYKTKPVIKKNKDNFDAIVNAAKKLGITSNHALAGLLSIVLKESEFGFKNEGTYRNTSVSRIVGIFGAPRVSKYKETDLDGIKKDDRLFFDTMYGPIALRNGYKPGRDDDPILGNTFEGSGFRYRGRGFNQLTFLSNYKKRSKEASVNLVDNPDKVLERDIAAPVLIGYFFDAFGGLDKNVAQQIGITKQSNPKATINSINDLEKSVDLFYLGNSGSMVQKNYNKLLNIKSNSTTNSEGLLKFPKDSTNGYTKARNSVSIIYQILTGENPVQSIPPKENEPSETKVPPTTQSPPEIIEQPSTVSEDELNKSNPKTVEFNPVQLTQIFPPTIKPTTISIDAQTTTERMRRDFLTGLGTGPFIYYNGIHIEYSDISYFELYHEGLLPAIKINYIDRNGIFKDTGFPLDDAIISIFLYSRSKRLRSINMDFKVSNFKDLGSNEFTIIGICDVPEIFLRKFKSYSKKTSFDALSEIAKECQLGFCSNIANSNDKMTWINTGFPNYQFIDNIVNNSYISDSSFVMCYVDFYYNLCYVDIEKELNRVNDSDQMVITDGKYEFGNDRVKDDDIAKLMLSTDYSVKGTNAFISEYVVVNKSTQVSLNKAYLTKTKFYDVKSKELLIFDVDSITSEGNKTIVLKGKPGDEEYFKKNVNNIWMGKLDKFEDDGNAHANFNYSFIQNGINKDQISKIYIEVKVPVPNYNLYIYQKIYLALIKQKPGLLHSSLRYKRLIGNWLSTGIGYIFDGSAFFQKITLVKRELEMDEYEREAAASEPTQTKKNTEDFQDNTNPLSPNDAPPKNPAPVENRINI